MDLIRSLYEGAYYAADLPYGRAARVYLTRGTKQGDVLSPLLFSLLFNALLLAIRQSKVSNRTLRGVLAPGKGFADDLVLMAKSAADMQTLVDVVADFCSWSGMRVKMQKSVITAYDYKQRVALDTDQVRYQGTPFVRLAPGEAFAYLGVRAALIAGSRKRVAPATGEEKAHVLSSTKELKTIAADHPYLLSQMVPAMQMVAQARLRYSAPLVPWTDAELEELYRIWLQVDRSAWRLQKSFPSAQRILPEEHAGCPVIHPRVIIVQALATHVAQLVAIPDEIRDAAIARFRRLCLKCGCANERELAEYLAAEPKPRPCPIARLLRACGQLQMTVSLPSCLTLGKAARETSWHALLKHLHVAAGNDLTAELDCVQAHWTAIRTRLHKHIRFPSQLVLFPRTDRPVWLLPETLHRARWLGAFRQLLRRVDTRRLFPQLDRREGAPEVPPHQQLVANLIAALQSQSSAQVQIVLRDRSWSQVSSSAPLASWWTRVARQGIEGPRIVDSSRRRVPVLEFLAIGQECSLQDLRALMLWLAPTLRSEQYAVDAEAAFRADVWSPILLSRALVVFDEREKDRDSQVRLVGPYTISTKNGLVCISDRQGHVGTVAQGRWGTLLTAVDEEDLAKILRVDIQVAEREERSRGVPSHQLWDGLRRAIDAQCVVGCSPLLAPACFPAAYRCFETLQGWGWDVSPITRIVYTLLCFPADEQRRITRRLKSEDRWLVLTRESTLDGTAKAELQAVGGVVKVFRRGSLVAAATGLWRKAELRSIQSLQDWTVWASKVLLRERGPLMRALDGIRLSRDGVVQLDPAGHAFQEACRGVAGSAYGGSGITVATDGSLSDEGAMGAAFVSLDPSLPSQSATVLGPESSLRPELTAIAMCLSAAPMDRDLNILTDSLESMRKLQSLQRKDFSPWMKGEENRALLRHVVELINRRVSAGVFTRFVKVPAHKGHPLNEAADAAARQAATLEPEEAAQVWPESEVVRFVHAGSLAPWGPVIRRELS